LPISDAESTFEEERHPLGSFDDASKSLMGLADKWLALEIPSVSRLAFGAILIHKADGVAAVNALLSGYLPGLDLSTEGCSDLNFQINRPRLSRTVRDLKLNRLSKWAVMTRQLVNLVPGTDPALVSEGTVARLELDMNTALEYAGELPAAFLSGILEELVGLAKETSERGDIP
jgi:hypothetical protein